MPRAVKKYLAAALMGILCLGLAGCLDYELNFTLKENGSGAVSATLWQPRHLAEPPGEIYGVILPMVVRQTWEEGNRLVVRDRSSFGFLDTVVTQGLRLEVREMTFGVMGLTARTYRVIAWWEGTDGDLPDRDVLPGTEKESRTPSPAPSDPDRVKARGLVTRGLAGHEARMVFDLPGRITAARPLIIGSSKVEPELGPDPGRVVWHLPLATLVNEAPTQTLEFYVEFTGHLNFRVPGQWIAESHPPTKDDWDDLADLKRGIVKKPK